MARCNIAHAPRVRSDSLPGNLFPRAIRIFDFRNESIPGRLRKREQQVVVLEDSLRIDRYPRIGVSRSRTPIGGWIAIVGEARGMLRGAGACLGGAIRAEPL